MRKRKSGTFQRLKERDYKLNEVSVKFYKALNKPKIPLDCYIRTVLFLKVLARGASAEHRRKVLDFSFFKDVCTKTKIFWI